MATRVALLLEYPTLNGGERSLLAALPWVDPRRFEIVALAPPGGRLAAALSRRSIRHVPLQLRDDQDARLPRQAACRRLVDAIRDAAPQIVHANSLSMARLTGAVAERLAIPCVGHLRDILKLRRAAIDDLNRNRVLIAVSQATRRFHVAQGLCADRTSVVHNGVDCRRFRPRTGRLCRELGLPAESFVILTIGQIGLRKGQDVLAAAAPAIAARLPGAQFVIVGERNSSKPESVAYERDLQARFAAAGLGGRLHRLGYRDDVPELMNEADLLAHPAKQEPLGRVLLEAAAAGLPIVATGVGGTEEILADGRSARLVPPGDAGRLAAAICDLAADPATRRRFAAAARQHVAASFTPQAAAAGLAAAWERALRSPTPKPRA